MHFIPTVCTTWAPKYPNLCDDWSRPHNLTPAIQTQVKAAATIIQKIKIKIKYWYKFWQTNVHQPTSRLDWYLLVAILESCFRSMNANRKKKRNISGSSPVGCFLRESPELFGLKQLFHVPLSAVFFIYIWMCKQYFPKVVQVLPNPWYYTNQLNTYSTTHLSLIILNWRIHSGAKYSLQAQSEVLD